MVEVISSPILSLFGFQAQNGWTEACDIETGCLVHAEPASNVVGCAALAGLRVVAGTALVALLATAGTVLAIDVAVPDD